MALVRKRIVATSLSLAAMASVSGLRGSTTAEAFAPALNGVVVRYLVVSPAYTRTGVVIAVG